MQIKHNPKTQKVQETKVSSNPTPPFPSSSSSPRQRRGFTIKNASDCRRMLVSITNQLLSGTITSEKYKAIIFGTHGILRAIELTLLEEKIVDLERKLKITKE
jgi:hypothetical protein